MESSLILGSTASLVDVSGRITVENGKKQLWKEAGTTTGEHRW